MPLAARIDITLGCGCEARCEVELPDRMLVEEGVNACLFKALAQACRDPGLRHRFLAEDHEEGDSATVEVSLVDAELGDAG